MIDKNCETEKNLQIESKDLDHLGIVAGIVDEIGLVFEINKLVGTNEQELVTSGQVVKAMILNCMGFLSAPLYLFWQFFKGKPFAHLLGEGVKAEHLNDTRLLRVLDKLYEIGLTKVFMAVVLRAASKFDIRCKRKHLDSSSFHVHGTYSENQENDFEIIRITHGYSKDHRPDLKQFLVNIMTTSDGDVPLFWNKAMVMPQTRKNSLN